MTALSLAPDGAPTARHRGQDDLPLVDLGDGTKLQLLTVDLAHGIWTVLTRFDPGTTIATHHHTGHVHAFTRSGAWYYLENPEAVNTTGSYLYEPAGSRHTLHVPETNDGPTDVWFTVHGANVNLDDDGNVTAVVDAHLIHALYTSLCATQHDVTEPPVVLVETPA